MKKYRKSKKRRKQNRERTLLQVALGLGAAVIFIRESDRILLGELPSLTSVLFGVGVSLLVLLVPMLLSYTRSEKRRIDYKNSSLYQIDQMDGIGFERYLKWLFEQRGYKASTTKTTGDFGADLIMTKEGKKIVVQAKRYGSNVGIQAIQEVFTAQHYFDCNEAWVVTNSRFTKSAKLVGNKLNVSLIGRDELESFVNHGKSEESIQTYRNESSERIRECPKCGHTLTLRNAQKGAFYGCSTFPTCKHTEKV